MAFQGRRHLKVDPRMSGLQPRYHLGQITFQVEPQGQEIGQHDDAADSFPDEAVDGGFEVRPAEFQEGRLDMAKRTHLGEVADDGADPLVGAFDPGAMGEEDQAGGHDPP